MTNGSSWRELRRGLSYLKPHRIAIPIVLALALGSSAFSALEPLVHGSIFRRLSGLGHRDEPVRALAGPILFLAFIVIGRQILEGTTTILSWRVRLRVNRKLLSDATDKLHALPLAYHQGHGVGETMTRLDRGITALMDGLSSVAFQMVPAFAYLVLSTVIMMRLHAGLAAVAIVFVFPPVLLGRKAAFRLLDQERSIMDRWCRIYNRFHQVLAGIKTVKAFARELQEQRLFVDSVRDAQSHVLANVDAQTRLSATQGIWVNLGRVAVLGVGGVLVIRGELELGALVTFLGYASGLYGPAQTLLGLYVTVRRAEFGLATFFKVIDAKNEVPDLPSAAAIGKMTGAIEFDKVTFSYAPSSTADGPPTLDDISLSITPGQFIALIGPSGAGKTTLIDLILRLHDPTSGVVRVDGRDLRELSQRDLRRHLGIVTQEPFLFDDTVATNIRYGCPEATDAQVERAARAAFAHDFVARLPDGYDTRIGRGGIQLSGGERQRVAIARTFLKDPAVVLLDEPTSSLDVESEQAVQLALERLAIGRTTIVVAHRLSLAARAERVVVLSRGKVVEDGPPQRLLAADGHYRRMMQLWRAEHPEPAPAKASEDSSLSP